MAVVEKGWRKQRNFTTEASQIRVSKAMMAESPEATGGGEEKAAGEKRREGRTWLVSLADSRPP